MTRLPCGCVISEAGGVVVECREAATLRATMNTALLRKIAARFDGGDVERAEREYRIAVRMYELHFEEADGGRNPIPAAR